MTATLKPTIPAGGILTQHVDEDFAAFVAGRTVEQRVLVAVVQAASVSSGNREAGRVNKTSYEAVHLVEVTDTHEADRVRHLITQIRADRGLAVKQPGLFDSTEDEQRDTVLGFIAEWQQETGTSTEDLDARWLDYHGGPEHAASAIVSKGSLQQLKEFALVIGVLPDETAAGKAESNAPAVLFSSDGDQGDDPDAGDEA